jgi:cobalamin biosynthetic protein CobC
VEEHRCLAECTAAQVVVLCNPNNPTGARLSRDALLACAEERTRKGGVLLVDEAFADFEHAALSVAPALPQPGLIVLRSFGKSYGLPGIRLGFVLAAPDFVQRIREVLGPWPVSGPAIAAGCAALPDTEWRDAAHMRLATDAGRLDALLIAAGMRIVGGTHLFRLAAHERAYALHEELAEAGILTRIFSKHPHWLRIGIPPGQPAFARLAQALGKAAPDQA